MFELLYLYFTRTVFTAVNVEHKNIAAGKDGNAICMVGLVLY